MESQSFALRQPADPAAFAARLTTPPLAFNSERGYSNQLILRIAQVSACKR